jgi:hypothetical protein
MPGLATLNTNYLREFCPNNLTERKKGRWVNYIYLDILTVANYNPKKTNVYIDKKKGAKLHNN